MRTTQRKGDIGVTRGIATFTELGYDVSLPVTESASYDFIVDDEDGLHRVQVKYSAERKDVDLRRVHSNSQGYVTKTYEKGAFDWLYVYSPLWGEYLFKDDLSGRTSVRIVESARLTK